MSNVNLSNNTSFENAKFIQINHKILKFGDSVYQFKNVTGFQVGEIPKSPFPMQEVLTLSAIGLLTLIVVIGLFFLIWVAVLVIKHFAQKQFYGLIIKLNSGETKFFVSEDKKFMMTIVSAIYEFMQSEDESKQVYIDMSNRSVRVGNMSGSTVVSGQVNGAVRNIR